MGNKENYEELIIGKVNTFVEYNCNWCIMYQ